MKYGYSPDCASITADEYEFHCSAPDCTEHAHDIEDFLKCESCGQLVCADHAQVAEGDGELLFCQSCFVCNCGTCAEDLEPQPAKYRCDECGELICAAHVHISRKMYNFDPGDDPEANEVHERHVCPECAGGRGFERETTENEQDLFSTTKESKMQEPMMPVSQVEKLVRVLMAMERRASIADLYEKRPADAAGIYKMIGRVMADNGLTTFREL